VTLRWDAIVSRAKNGSPSVHPLSGVELRAPAQARPGAVVTVRVHVRGWRAFGDMMDALVETPPLTAEK
jgi:hypothetical protein